VPDSLYLFLSVLLEGESALDSLCEASGADQESNLCEDDEEDPEANSDCASLLASSVTLSIAQDIVYAVSKGKKQTPKHIDLACTLQRATRSKRLVNLFHAAGHCINYYHVSQVDKTLASLTLQSADQETGAVVPPNNKHSSDFENRAPILLVTADNIDIMTDSLDGKKGFPATQMVAFQREGRDTSEVLNAVRVSKGPQKIPPEFNTH